MPSFTGNVRQLGATAAALAASLNGTKPVRSSTNVSGPTNVNSGTMGYEIPQLVLPDISQLNWPSASQPVPPIGPPGSEPLAISYWYGQNLNMTPRSDALYSASQLQALSKYFLARVCIENVKDIITGQEWSIQVKPQIGETRDERSKRSRGDQNLLYLSRFFERPGGREWDWRQWSRRLLEDMLVTDTGCCYNQRSLGKTKKPLAFIPLEGASILRYINDHGMTPEPPYAAYAQCYQGMPRVPLSTDQLIYRPRNIAPNTTVASKLYGNSPTEQSADVIKLGIQKLYWSLSFFTRGSIPDMIHFVPYDADSKQVTAAMEMLNSQLAGQLAERHQIRMIQGFQKEGKAEQALFPKKDPLADALDDLIIRYICFTYGCSPQRLLRMLNRATAQQNQQSAEDEGTKPFTDWLLDFVNYIIEFHFGMPGYVMGFEENEENDIVKRSTAMTTNFNKGIWTWNDAAKFDNRDPIEEDWANKPCVMTPQGVTIITGEPVPPPAPAAAPGAPAAAAKPKPAAATPPKRVSASQAKPGANRGVPGKPAAKKPAVPKGKAEESWLAKLDDESRSDWEAMRAESLEAGRVATIDQLSKGLSAAGVDLFVNGHRVIDL